MPSGVEVGPLVNNIGVVSGCLILVALFVSDKIVSGKRLRRTEADRDRWQDVALESLRAAQVVVPAAETVHRLVTHLPDPGSEAEAMSTGSTPP